MPTEENKGGGGGPGNDCLRADYPYSFGIQIKNPATPAAAAASRVVTAELRAEHESQVVEIAATPLTFKTGQGEVAPLFVPDKLIGFRSAALGQTSAVPAAANAICVTLSLCDPAPRLRHRECPAAASWGVTGGVGAGGARWRPGLRV